MGAALPPVIGMLTHFATDTSFSHWCVTTQRLEPSWDKKISRTRRSLDMKEFVNEYIVATLDPRCIRNWKVRFSHVGKS